MTTAHDPMCPQAAHTYPLTHCLCSLVADLHAAVLIARGAKAAK